MTKYVVQASETVFYDIIVEAENEEEAKELVLQGEVPTPEPIDSCDFEIDRVQLY